MSTQDKANNELDDLFRKSLEEPNIPFDPQAWQAMEKKLDKFQSDRAAYWKSFFGLLALLLVTTSLGIWHQTSRKNKSQLTVIEQPVQASNPASENNSGQKKSTTQIGQKHRQSTHSQPETAIKRKDLAKKKPVKTTDTQTETGQIKQENLKKKKETDLKEGLNKLEKESKPVAGLEKELGSQWLLEKNSKEAPKKTKAVPIEKESKPKEFKKPSEGSTVLIETNKKGKAIKKAEAIFPLLPEKKSRREKTSNPISDSSEIHESTSFGITESQELILATLFIRPVQLLSTKLSVPELPFNLLPVQKSAIPAAQPTDSVPTLAKRRKPPLEHSFSLNLMGAPDLSTVGFSHFTTPGINLGLAVEYGFSKRLSILVGALYATKIYNAGAEDYTPAKGWLYGVPEQIKGNCKVIDLPINLRYNAWITEQYKFYVSAGISSYLMQKEHYNYFYKGYPTTPWTAPTGNHHWLSVANFSVGYEYKLSKVLSLQIEPYVKIPLAGVGAGKVKLATTGAFFILKYYFGK